MLKYESMFLNHFYNSFFERVTMENTVQYDRNNKMPKRKRKKKRLLNYICEQSTLPLFALWIIVMTVK